MNEQIRFGVVGLGRGLRVMTEILDEDHVTLAAICDRNPQKREEALKQLKTHGITDMLCFEDYEEMLKTDIIKVISNYMEIDLEELDIQITQTESDDNTGTVPVLYANIPIKSMRKVNQED